MQLTTEQKECLSLYLDSQRKLKKALKLLGAVRQKAWDLRDELENNEFACMSVVAERYYTITTTSFGLFKHENRLARIAREEKRIKRMKLIRQNKTDFSKDIPF